MSRTVTITLDSNIGADLGPFSLYSSIDGHTTPFETGISRAALIAGYKTTLAPKTALYIRVQSTGNCTNFTDLALPLEPSLPCNEYTVDNTGGVSALIGNYQTCNELVSTGINLSPGQSITFCSANVPSISSGDCPGGNCITSSGACVEGYKHLIGGSSAGINCSTPPSVTVYSSSKTYAIGNVLYNLIDLTNNYKGNGNWYNTDQNVSIQINSFGVITDLALCP
jgi:hypothetical protein